jgi:hypothetical protein
MLQLALVSQGDVLHTAARRASSHVPRLTLSGGYRAIAYSHLTVQQPVHVQQFLSLSSMHPAADEITRAAKPNFISFLVLNCN